eukprot:3761326-Prorocentrum_lima.AAC.1
MASNETSSRLWETRNGSPSWRSAPYPGQTDESCRTMGARGRGKQTFTSWNYGIAIWITAGCRRYMTN